MTYARMTMLVAALMCSSAQALDCQSATTQVAMTQCAYADFEAAGAEQAAALRSYVQQLSTAEQQRWRVAQKSWTQWRTAQCAFESGSLAGGSARQMVQWQCAARLTRLRSVAIQALANCPEGDLACPGRRR